MTEYSYIGTAIRKPLVLTQGRVTTVSGLSVLEQSIVDILTTPVGSKFFLPEYGSRLHELIFEPSDTVLFALFKQLVREAISKWETRVDFVDGQFVINEDRIECNITYRVLPTNEINSFVFPYYTNIVY